MKAHKLFGKDKKQDDQTGLDTLSEEVRNFNFRKKKNNLLTRTHNF